jgi:hypothetical protein
MNFLVYGGVSAGQGKVPFRTCGAVPGIFVEIESKDDKIAVTLSLLYSLSEVVEEGFAWFPVFAVVVEVAFVL